MVGDLISKRLRARAGGARQFVGSVSRNVKDFAGDVIERLDLDENVPQGTLSIILERKDSALGLIAQTEKNFAKNNRLGLGAMGPLRR